MESLNEQEELGIQTYISLTQETKTHTEKRIKSYPCGNEGEE